MKPLLLTVFFAAAALGLLLTMVELPPANIFIDLLASDDGRFPVTPVWLLTTMTGFLPFALVVGAVGRLTAARSSVGVSPTATGIWVTRPMHWQGVVLIAPVFIDEKCVAKLAVGRSLFFELEPGTHRVALGKRKRDAATSVEVLAGAQTRLEVSFADGSFVIAGEPMPRAA